MAVTHEPSEIAMGCSSPPCGGVQVDRSRTLVQLEPIRMTTTRAANAVGFTAQTEISLDPFDAGNPLEIAGPLAGH